MIRGQTNSFYACIKVCVSKDDDEIMYKLYLGSLWGEMDLTALRTRDSNNDLVQRSRRCQGAIAVRAAVIILRSALLIMYFHTRNACGERCLETSSRAKAWHLLAQ